MNDAQIIVEVIEPTSRAVVEVVSPLTRSVVEILGPDSEIVAEIVAPTSASVVEVITTSRAVVELTAPVSASVIEVIIPGPQGLKGDPGNLTSIGVQSFVATEDGEQIFTITGRVISSSMLYINGLPQAEQYWSIDSNQLVTVPAGFNVIAGDTITLRYTTTRPD